LLGLPTGSSISAPFLWTLIFWLALIFTRIGSLTRSNATVLGALLVRALSVSSAIFMIWGMDCPFGGRIQISSQPMRDALDPPR